MKKSEIKLLSSVYYSLVDLNIGNDFETGGIIGGVDGVITHFAPDKSTHIKDRNMYVPNTEYLSGIISDWSEQSVELYGIFHTHPKGQTTLSNDDMDFISSFFDLNPGVQAFYFPIVISGEKVYFYKAVREKNKISVNSESLAIILL